MTSVMDARPLTSFSSGSSESYVIGFLVPNQKQLLVLAKQHSIRGSWEELCSSAAVEELVVKVVTEAALAGGGASEGR